MNILTKKIYKYTIQIYNTNSNIQYKFKYKQTNNYIK